MTDVPPTAPADGTPPPPPAAPTTPPAAPGQPGAMPPPGAPAPAPRPSNPGSATTLVWRRRDRATLTGALTAVIVAWVLAIVHEVLYLFVSLSYAFVNGFGYVLDSFGEFFFEGLWRALFFFGPAFVVLWLLLPIVKESTLPQVLKRAAAAGVAGLAGLVFFGIFEIISAAIRGFLDIAVVAVDFLWWPLYVGFGFTALLVIGATVAWLRSNRPPKAAAAVPAAPAAPTV